MTKLTDTPESPNESSVLPSHKYCVLRRLKKDTYRKDLERFYYHWIDWHYFPINHLMYADVFDSKEDAEKHIEKQKIEWPNFDFKIVNQDG